MELNINLLKVNSHPFDASEKSVEEAVVRHALNNACTLLEDRSFVDVGIFFVDTKEGTDILGANLSEYPTDMWPDILSEVARSVNARGCVMVYVSEISNNDAALSVIVTPGSESQIYFRFLENNKIVGDMYGPFTRKEIHQMNDASDESLLN